MLNFAANISFLFQERPLLDRFQAARDAGFAAVEVQFPYAESLSDLSRVRDESGVDVVLINAPSDIAGHAAGIACRGEFKKEFAAAVARTCDYAEALGVRHVNVLAGCCEDGEDRVAANSTLCDNLLRANDRLGPLGVSVLLEPINTIDVPGYLIDSPEQAADIIARCDGHIGLQFDAYHMCMMRRDPTRVLQSMLKLVRHVQFADAPGRHEPGTGAAPLTDVLDLLNTSAYQGWVGAEYRPSTSTEASLSWLAAWTDRYALPHARA